MALWMLLPFGLSALWRRGHKLLKKIRFRPVEIFLAGREKKKFFGGVFKSDAES